MGLVSRVSSKVMPFGIPLKFDFPPGEMLNPAPQTELPIAQLEERTRRLAKLENLYHKGQAASWDGKAVLAELVERHGGVQASPEKRAAIAEVFTIILWGELAAWEVSSYLAEAHPGLDRGQDGRDHSDLR